MEQKTLKRAGYCWDCYRLFEDMDLEEFDMKEHKKHSDKVFCCVCNECAPLEQDWSFTAGKDYFCEYHKDKMSKVKYSYIVEVMYDVRVVYRRLASGDWRVRYWDFN